jgi:hypothetical protein
MLVGIGGVALTSIATKQPRFVPTNISGVLAWISADVGAKDVNGNNITADNTTVYTISDRSGNGKNLTNNAGNGPKWRNGANGQNGLPVFQFNGTTQFVNFASNVTPTANFTYFIVFKGTRAGTFGYANRAQGTVAGGNTGFTLGMTPTSVYAVVRPAAASPSADFGITGGSYPNTITTTITLGTGGGKMRINKTQVAAEPTATSWGLSGPATEYVGRDPDVYFEGTICEIIIYNSILSANNITLVENYLTAKWNT